MRAALEKLNHSPNKKLGQNFLIDGNIVKKSIEMAGVDGSDTIVEIGPGLGQLTRALSDKGATVWAIERDPVLFQYLKANLIPDYPKLHLLEGDCLKTPLAGLPERSKSKFKIVANLPYAVSTPWMDSVLNGALPDQMVLMLQKEAADRYRAMHGSKSFGAISIFLQSAYAIEGQHFVSARCFHPVPKVDSVLLHLVRRKGLIRFSKTACGLIRKIFTQRRKQLGTLCRNDPRAGVHEWFQQMVDSGVKPTIRPEELPIENWQSLKL